MSRLLRLQLSLDKLIEDLEKTDAIIEREKINCTINILKKKIDYLKPSPKPKGKIP